jgi:mRNA interferase RelE/StbE
MTFKVQLDKQPENFLGKADKVLLERLCKKIEALKDDPIPHDAKRVINRREKTFRVRVGDYRILYIVYFESGVLLVSKIDKRSRAYD